MTYKKCETIRTLRILFKNTMHLQKCQESFMIPKFYSLFGLSKDLSCGVDFSVNLVPFIVR